VTKDINARIAAEISWACTPDPTARTRPAREAFLKRFDKEVVPDGVLPPQERRQRAGHAKRAYMLQFAKRSKVARKTKKRSTVDGGTTLGPAGTMGPMVAVQEGDREPSAADWTSAVPSGQV
jgi:hypothetical protein